MKFKSSILQKNKNEGESTVAFTNLEDEKT